ncbi:MAG: hypothetical protein A3K13_08925 [Gemmatimonadetes bacterium RIFCSPLOWO2_12_FULL_68_9]|nr:MAG: hypothetical protein A3K13_08925 [Gemmatimonadetes bacterium RIFCSPLOWO2_12_FULL_68_9]
MALTALLLYVSGLAVHSYVQAVTFDYGFDADRVLLFTPPPWARPGMTTHEDVAAFAEHKRKVEASIESLRGAPGIVSASTFFWGPLGLGISRTPHFVPGAELIREFDGRGVDVQARGNAVGVDFVRTLGATIIAGHDFDDPECAGQDNIALVNETLARRLAPGIGGNGPELWPSVVGRKIRTRNSRGQIVGVEIVGVVRDLVETTPAVTAGPQYFMPDRTASVAVGMAIRASPSTEAALPAVRVALERVWGPLRSRQFGPMRDDLERVLVPYRAQSVLLSLIAAFCLPIAAIGLLGGLTYSVRVRTREMAIRIAIGADPCDVRRSVVRRALGIVAAGIVLGTSVGALIGSVIARQLLNVHAADLPTMVSVSAGLLAVGWLASVIPARHASRIEPATALRQE